MVLERILDVWLEKLSLVSQPERRKLLGLALASLLPSRLRYIFLFLIFVVRVDVFGVFSVLTTHDVSKY